MLMALRPALRLLLTLSCCVLGVLASAQQVALQSSPVALPKNAILPVAVVFRYWQGLPVVEGTVNSKWSTAFVLHTGLNACALSPIATTRSSIPPTPKQAKFNVLDITTVAPEIQVATLEFLQLKLENVPMVKTDVFQLLSHSPRPDAPPGCLGTPFLSAFQVTLDFGPKQILLLNSPKTPLPDDPETVVVPITVREGRLYTKVSIPGSKPFTALVDTGTLGTLIPREVAQKLKLKPTQIFTMRNRSGKEAKAALLTLPKISVGKATLQEVQAIALTPEAPPEFDPAFAVLGMDFLRHYKVTISYAKQKMALSPYTQSESSTP